MQNDYGYGEFDLNAVAFGKAKGKGKSKGFQGKGYSTFGAKGQKGGQEKGTKKEQSPHLAVSSREMRLA